jgi:chromosome segregation ATPase
MDKGLLYGMVAAIFGMGVTLTGKIVWDWLRSGKGNVMYDKVLEEIKNEIDKKFDGLSDELKRLSEMLLGDYAKKAEIKELWTQRDALMTEISKNRESISNAKTRLDDVISRLKSLEEKQR